MADPGSVFAHAAVVSGGRDRGLAYAPRLLAPGLQRGLQVDMLEHGSKRVTTERPDASSPRKSPTRAATSLRSHAPARSECTQSRKDRNAYANSRASDSEALVIIDER
jgi:hypothetical protein